MRIYLENIAALTQTVGFLGCCSLVPQMEAYKAYEEAVLYVQNAPFQDASVINSSIISSAQGYYGNYHLTQKTEGSLLWISPLMPIYCFLTYRQWLLTTCFCPNYMVRIHSLKH